MFGELGSELPKILLWYTVFLILGISSLPFLNKYFNKWKDGGYGIGKIIALSLVSLPLWFLASIKVIPFTQTTALLFFCVFIGVSIWYGVKTKFKFSRSLVKWIIFEELMFLLIFVAWTFIRSTNSQVEGTEKMMNIAFMNSIFRTEYFPVADPWYYGGTINYYHLGHYMFTYVAKMTGIPISFAYNFALNTIAGFTFIGAFSIIIKLINKKGRQIGSVLTGLFGATWLCFGANFHYLYKWLSSALVTLKPFEYWFPEGTRIINNAIDEFPGYSIPLGDLHGHYLGMPFTIIMIALFIVSSKIKIGSKEKVKFNITISILVGALFGVNTWDFITAIFLFGLLYSYQALTTYKLWSDRLLVVFISMASLVIPGLVFMIPYFVNFHAPVGGIGFVPFGKTSDLFEWLMMWGMFVAITACFMFMKSFVNNNVKQRIVALFIFVTFVTICSIGSLQSPLAVEKIEGGGSKIVLVGGFEKILFNWLVIFLTIGVIVALITFIYKKFKLQLDYKKGKYEYLVHLLTLASLALITGVEVLFVKDIFYESNPPFFRTNTVFKFYYHAWIIWCITCSYYVYKVFETFLNSTQIRARITGALVSFIIIILYIGSVSYAFEAIKDFYPFMKYDNYAYPTWEQWQSKDINNHVKIYDSIDGNTYIKRSHAGDYDAMQWLNANVKGQPTVVEAVGDAYTYYARFSANVGVVNIMGWPTHEWQWRSNPIYVKDPQTGVISPQDTASADVFNRKAEVEKIYKTKDINELKGLIAKYNVQYIIIGEKEVEAYKDEINETLISQIAGKVYDQNNTRIYRIMYGDMCVK